MTFERTLAISAPAELVFDYVSSISNFPTFLPTVHSAEEESAGRVEITGHGRGGDYRTSGSLRLERENLRMSWDSDDHPGYQGWLQVRAGDTSPDISELTLHITEPQANDELRQHEGAPDGWEEQVQSRLMEVLTKVRDEVQGLAAR